MYKEHLKHNIKKDNPKNKKKWKHAKGKHIFHKEDIWMANRIWTDIKHHFLLEKCNLNQNKNITRLFKWLNLKIPSVDRNVE